MIQRTARSARLPYTNLFRSERAEVAVQARRDDGRKVYLRGDAAFAVEGPGLSPGAWRVRVSALHRGAGRQPRSLNRSEEHTSELQSRLHLVCPVLLAARTLA